MERIKCKKCGEFLTSANFGYAVADEKTLVTTFKMIASLGKDQVGLKNPLDNMDEYICGACGHNCFEIVNE